MREIKSRVWNGEDMEKSTLSFNFEDGQTKKEIHIYPEDIFMQYTGLKDKNGVEIYEGDIVDGSMNYSGYTFVSHVSFFDGAFRIDNGSLVCNATLEIIGNMYENPELLEAK